MARFLVEILVNAAGEPQVKAAFESIGASAGASSKSVEAAALRSEASLRRTAEAAAKLKEQMTDTKAGKGMLADMAALNKRLEEQITAFRGDSHSIAEYSRKQKESAEASKILAAQVRAGVSAESEMGRAIAEQIKLHSKLQSELDRTRAKEQEVGVSAEEASEHLRGAMEGIAALIAFDFIKDQAKESFEAVVELRSAQMLLDAAVKSTGGVVGYTTAQLEEMAEKEEDLIGVEKDVVSQAERTLLTYTRIGHDVFPRTLKAVEDLAAGLGQSLPEAAALAGKALDDPLKASRALRSAHITVTASMDEEIKRYAKLHDLEGAQGVILAEIEKRYGGAAAAAHKARAGTDDLEIGIRDLHEEIGAAMIPAVQQLSKEITALISSGANKQQMEDFGTAIGNGLLLGGKGAAFAVEHFEAIKNVMIGIAILRAPAMIMAVVEAVGKLAVASRGAALANPLLWIPIALLGVNEFIAGVRDADAANIQLNVNLGNLIGNVLTLREKYGQLTEAQVESAKTGLEAFRIRSEAIKAEIGAIDKVLTSRKHGNFWSRALDSTKDLAEERRGLQEENNNLSNILSKMDKRLDEHSKHIKKAASDTSDWGDKTEDAAKKAQHIADILASWDKALQSLLDKEKDQQSAVTDSIGSQEALLAAIRDGIIAYGLEEQSQARALAVKQALNTADRDYRTTVEQLTEVIKKLHEAKDTKDEQAKLAELEKLKASYASYRSGLEETTKKEFDLKQQVKDGVATTQSAIAADTAYAQVQASLADLISGTADATREVARETAIRTAAERASHTTDAEGIEIAKDRAAADFDRVEATKAIIAIERAQQASARKVIDAQQSLSDWQAQREATLRYGDAIASILDHYDLLSSAAHQRAIEEQLATARAANATDAQLDALRRELEADQAIIDGLHRIQAEAEIAERRYREFAANLSGALGDVIDQFMDDWKISLSDFEHAAVDSFRSVLRSMIQEWLDKWFQAMAAWLVRWLATQAAARAGSAALGTGSVANAQAYMGYGASASQSGGYLAGAKSLFSGTGTYGATGASAAWMGVFAAAVVALLHQQKTSGRAEVDTTLKLGGGSGIGIDEELSHWNNQGGLSRFRAQLKAMESMISAVTDFIKSAGGAIDTTIKSTSSITVSREGQGKHTNWFVKYADGLVKHFGSDMQAAMSFAMVQAIKQAPTIGLSPEVESAIRKSSAASMDQLQKDIDLAMSFVRERLGDVGSKVYDTIKAFYARVADAAKLGIDVDPSKLTDQLGDIRDELLGVSTATAKFLASLLDFQEGIAEGSRAMRAQLEANIADLNSKIAELEATGPRTFETPDGTVRTQSNDAWQREIQRLKDQVAKYILELDKIPQALSDQEINMGIFDKLYEYLKGNKKYSEEALKYAKLKVEIEFAAIKLQLVLLGKWEQFAQMFTDAYNAALNAAGKPERSGGGGKNRDDARRSLRDEIGRMRAEDQGSVHAALFDLNKQIEDFTKRAKEAKLPAAELAEGILLLTKRFRQGLQDQANAAAGVGTDFTAKLEGIQRFFDELKALGRGKTGMPDWLVRLLEGRALDRLGAELNTALDQFNGIVDPMAAINTQADILRQNVIAYGKAAGWTAEQIQAALDKIDSGVDYQRTSAIYGIMDTLFGYLKEDAKYAGKAKELKEKEIDLQFTLIEAQLKALGAWDAGTEEIFDAAKKAAKEVETAGAKVANVIYGYQVGEKHMTEDLAKAIEDAKQGWRSAVAQFTDQTKALLLNPTLTGLTQKEQFSTAQSEYRKLLAAAAGGDTDALGKLDAARQEYLTLARTMFGGGEGFSSVWKEIMKDSADTLAGAQATEASVVQKAIQDFASGASKNTQTITNAIYASANIVAEALYAGLNGLPKYADGGIVTRAHMAMVGERGPEAIIPLSRYGRVLQYAPASDTAASNRDGGGGGSSSALVSAVERLGATQSRMAATLRDISAASARTARSNEGMMRTERVRAMMAKRG